jgi:hypothetical protein
MYRSDVTRAFIHLKAEILEIGDELLDVGKLSQMINIIAFQAECFRLANCKVQHNHQSAALTLKKNYLYYVQEPNRWEKILHFLHQSVDKVLPVQIHPHPSSLQCHNLNQILKQPPKIKQINESQESYH